MTAWDLAPMFRHQEADPLSIAGMQAYIVRQPIFVDWLSGTYLGIVYRYGENIGMATRGSDEISMSLEYRGAHQEFLALPWASLTSVPGAWCDMLDRRALCATGTRIDRSNQPERTIP